MLKSLPTRAIPIFDIPDPGDPVFSILSRNLLTFTFLLILDVVMLVTIPQDLTGSEFMVEIAISLWVIILVCVIFTPIIYFWHRGQLKKISALIQYLNDQKKLRRDYDLSKS